MTRRGWWETGPFAAEDEKDLRADAGRILWAGIEAADPERAVGEALERRAAEVEAARRVFIVAVGKAAVAMSRGAVARLGARIESGVVIAPPQLLGNVPKPLASQPGDHPLPGPASLKAGHAVARLIEEVSEDDVVICLVSGGASTLAVRPVEGLRLEDLRAITDGLLRAGAPIGELNIVRKHIDALKGGRLACDLFPARVLGFLVSDVPGNAPDVIGSAPLVGDASTWADTRAVLENRLNPYAIPDRVREVVAAGMAGALPETPKPGDPRLCATQIEVVGSAEHALRAAADRASSLGYDVDEDARHVTGEARVFGRRLASQLLATRPGRCALIRIGETTVHVMGQGLGGRNQEVALGAAATLRDGAGLLVAAMGTDGVDGPTDAAGAIVTGSTVRRAAQVGLDPARALANNDAWSFFQELGDLIRSGPTGTNVMDLTIALSHRINAQV